MSIPGRPLADGEEDVRVDGSEFRVEEPLQTVVLRVGRGATVRGRAHVAIAGEQVVVDRVLGGELVDEPHVGQHRQEPLASRGVAERPTCVEATVNARVVTDDVEVRVRVAVPVDGVLAGRAHPERVARAVGDVVHDEPLPVGVLNPRGSGRRQRQD